MTQYKNLLLVSCFLLAIGSGCKKDYFNRPPENALTVGTYYQTVAQVQNSTDILYAAPWFGLNGKAFLAIGDLAGGNAACYSGTDGSFDAFRNLSEGNATQTVQSAWNALYTVVAQSNELLINLPGAATTAGIPTATINNALGEAHLIRGLAYFYLVRLFGNVPIITNPTNDANTFTSVPTNPVTDVYKFITNDMGFAVRNCTAGVANTGHASSNSAAGMLAKVYLYEQNYDSARYFAELAINSGEFGLVGLDAPGTFTSMFELAGNNCKESMIALQWTSNAGYGFGNQLQSVIAANSTITGTGDGYGELGPSWDLQDAFKTAGDSIRRHGTIMLGNDFYPELQKAAGGYSVPPSINEQGMHAGMKKYVVGDPDDNGGLAAKQATSNNTYLLRLADVYLVEAEAILGKAAGVQPGSGIPLSASTADPTALKYFNAVRQRAGLTSLSSFTYLQLLNERRLEFAIEGDYWYDLCRIDGFNNQHHPTAISIISAQNRGNSSGAGTAPNYTDFTRNTYTVTPTDNQFLLPIPASESSVDPALLQPPVPYKF
ncbi:MAG TPA: RagB/SusD family nutrient uptake outer membrane protein [Puia sp.]|uniref:RagB/SusD family nutrient uptake outer membrane protein n=1 Tax=Puia sp. TaxID=2045100 RepID=UPI002CABB229|nr:RagB/SusD family nutrient uptake outer membrane protein [Puia sp.]HVU94016.1 RagB/SusD family nutrient uptake outer membrane protein [Puia sp.]